MTDTAPLSMSTMAALHAGQAGVRWLRHALGLAPGLALGHALALALALAIAAMIAAGAWSSPLAAQNLETFDPDDAFARAPATDEPAVGQNRAIDADLVEPASSGQRQPTANPLPVVQPLPAPTPDAAPARVDEEFAIYSEPPFEGEDPAGQPLASAQSAGDAATAGAAPTVAANGNTFAEDDLIGAAEGVFGKGAEGLARMIEDLLKKEGQPNAYIVGREAGGAFVVGARYGSGTLHHKIEGERKVYWTGPSIGFDAGANAANTFVLVYNLWDSEDLFKRYPAGEGQAYLVGGLHASYVRRGDVVLIPIRMGAGLRLGVNAGYMKFSKKQRWLPF